MTAKKPDEPEELNEMTEDDYKAEDLSAEAILEHNQREMERRSWLLEEQRKAGSVETKGVSGHDTENGNVEERLVSKSLVVVDETAPPSEMSGKEPFSKEKPSRKRVLIACEESQAVCMEFRKLGFEAFSCDILPCSGGHPKWHIQDDVLKHLDDGWDLMIAHPPCTHIAVSGAAWFKEKIADGRQQRAIEFVEKLWEADIPKICVENPVGVLSTKSKLEKPTQIIQPYQFGEPHSKKTCLWLKNLPKLEPTKIVEPEYITYKSGKRMPKWYAQYWGNKDREKLRSKTFQGIAQAMAEQWGRFL